MILFKKIIIFDLIDMKTHTIMRTFFNTKSRFKKACLPKNKHKKSQ